MARRVDGTAVDGDDHLLNIRQAARLLNASEVSLRRWTDAGLLPCVRIGSRRERRFRREDLLTFPERRRAVRSSGEDMSAAFVSLEGLSIDYSNHLCSLYETDEGRTKLAVPFLAEGIRRGDVCFLNGGAGPVRQLLDHLRKEAPGTDTAIRQERLVVWNGFKSVEATLAAFEDAFFKATRAGVPGLRVVGDMAWFFEHGMGFEDLERFELSYNHKLAHRFAVVSLCLYDVREFSGRHVLGALKCHEDTFKYPLARFLGP